MASFLLSLFLLSEAFGQSPHWVMQESRTQSSLRGVSAVDGLIVWASGSAGTWLRTIDGGVNWQTSTVSGAEDLDFRGIRAFSANRAILMSAGPGAKSRVYETTDAGSHWTLLFTNPDSGGFWDAIAFWDDRRGILAGDSVNGQITVFTTLDGGKTWQRQKTPPALEGEGAFAASNTSLTLRGKREAWFGSSGSRVFHSMNGGNSWTVSSTPVRRTSTSSGIFSIAFSNPQNGIVVGGDYAKDSEPQQNIAITANRGKTWTAPPAGPAGFRSAVLWLADIKAWLATGTSGSDLGTGAAWKMFDPGAFHALNGKSSRAVWAAGPKGRIARLEFN